MKTLFLSALTIASAVSCYGQTLMGWDASQLTGASDYLRADRDAYKHATGFQVSDWSVTGITTNSVSGAYRVNGFPVEWDISNHYTSFTMTADAGMELQLTGIIGIVASTASNRPTDYAWGYRVIEDGGYTEWTTKVYSHPGGLPLLSGAQFLQWDFDDELITSGAVEIAFWAWGGTNPARNVLMVFDPDGGLNYGFEVLGTTEAIPEPSTIVLLGAGAAFAIWRRMKKA